MFRLDTFARIIRHASPRSISRVRYEDPPAGDPPSGGGGGGNNAVFESMAIPEQYKDSAAGKYTNVGELLKGYENANKLIGAKGVIIPGEKATPEEWNKYYNDSGRPEKADGYKFSPVEGLHPKASPTPESESEFKAFMHKNGIPARQADGLYKDYLTMGSDIMKKREAEIKTETDKVSTQLRTEWGADYDKNLASATNMLTKYGGQEALDHYNQNGYGRDPVVLKALAKIAKNFNEDTFVKGNPASGNSDTALKLKNIMLDKKHAYWVDGPGHDEAVKEVLALQESLTPNEKGIARE